jgi:hypothetical protein
VARASTLEEENVWLQAAVLEREKEATHLRRTLSTIAATAARACQSSPTPLAADTAAGEQPVRYFDLFSFLPSLILQHSRYWFVGS